MHARLAAALICLCGRALASAAGTDSVPPGAPPAAPAAPATTLGQAPPVQTQAAREPRAPAGTQAQDVARRAPAPPPPPADAAQRERGLMLAGLALMVGIALRRLGAGAP